MAPYRGTVPDSRLPSERRPPSDGRRSAESVRSWKVSCSADRHPRQQELLLLRLFAFQHFQAMAAVRLGGELLWSVLCRDRKAKFEFAVIQFVDTEGSISLFRSLGELYVDRLRLLARVDDEVAPVGGD